MVIKFSGIAVDKQTQIYGHNFFSSMKLDESTEEKRCLDFIDGNEIVDGTASFYCNLKDRLGNELYLGDVFQYKKHDGYLLDSFYAVISFQDGCFGYSEYVGSKFFHPFSAIDELQHDFLNHIVKVGTIHLKRKNGTPKGIPSSGKFRF